MIASPTQSKPAPGSRAWKRAGAPGRSSVVVVGGGRPHAPDTSPTTLTRAPDDTDAALWEPRPRAALTAAHASRPPGRGQG